MIIYNVTLKVEADVADNWVSWMKNEHIPDVMSSGLFTDSRLCRLLDQDEADGLTFAAQYFCNGIEQYNEYINKHATAMRDKAFHRFGGKFIAFRTVMEVL